MDSTEGERLLQQAEQMRAVAREISTRSFSAKSANGMITVSALATGQVVALEIDPRVYRDPDSVGLAASILQTLNEAVAGASNMQLESLNQAVGLQAGSLGSVIQDARDLADELFQDAEDARRSTY